MAEAAEERLRNLHLLEDRALASQDIDTAAGLRAKIRAAEEGETESRRLSSAAREDEMNWLKHRLDGTLWHWDNDFIRFESDGTVKNAERASRGIATQWKVIDTRTVMLSILKGRRDNMTAILTFSPKADSYSGWGYDGERLPTNKPVIYLFDAFLYRVALSTHFR